MLDSADQTWRRSATQQMTDEELRDELVFLCAVQDLSRAMALRSAFEAEGLFIHVGGENHRGMLGFLGSFIEMRVMVRSSELERATILAREILGMGGEVEGETDGEKDWDKVEDEEEADKDWDEGEEPDEDWEETRERNMKKRQKMVLGAILVGLAILLLTRLL